MDAKVDLIVRFPRTLSSEPGTPFYIDERGYRQDMCFIADVEGSTGALLISTERQDQPHVLSYEQRVRFAALSRKIEYETIYTDAKLIHEHTRGKGDDVDQKEIARQEEVVSYYKYGREIGASEMRIVVHENHGVIRFKKDNLAFQKKPISRDHARLLQNSLYNTMTDEGGVQLREREYQDANLRHEFAIKAGLANARISTFPLKQKGLCVTSRLIPKEQKITKTIDNSGYPDHVVDGMKGLLRKRYGVFLVTGPTGSGKSTLAKVFLEQRARYHKDRQDIFTVEHPVEYEMIGESIMQGFLPVDHQDEEDLPRAWKRAGRALLRQAPNVIFPGEARDGDAARFVYEMAATGHFCMTTLHVNSVDAALLRLDVDFGVSRLKLFDPSQTVAILNMDLIRTVCPACAAPLKEHLDLLSPAERELWADYVDFDRARVGLGHDRHGEVCENCEGEGNVGRTPAMEFVKPTLDYFKAYADGGAVGARLHWINNMHGRTKVMHVRRLINQGLVDPRVAGYDVNEINQDNEDFNVAPDMNKEFVYG